MMRPFSTLLRLLAALADRLLATPASTWESASWSTTDSRQRTPGSPASAALHPPVGAADARHLDRLIDPYLRSTP